MTTVTTQAQLDAALAAGGAGMSLLDNVRTEPAQVEVIRRTDGITTVANLTGFALKSWTGMLILGALHTFHPGIPAIGYAETLLWVLLLGHIGSSFQRTLRTWSKPKRGRR